MSSEIAIKVSGLGKCFNTYDHPQDRLRQSLYSLASRLMPEGPRRQHLRLKAQACARNFWALNDVNFEIQKGETVGIIGRNGSGKSTLLQIICGTLSPTHGQVEVKGRVAALLELGSGFNPEYSGRENVFMNGQLLGLTREQISQRFDDIAAFADIGDFIDQPVKAYSSGMYVRLAFAVIAHVDADILVIDEALAVGDAFFTQKCMRFLRKFMQTGTVLFVSHDTAAIKNLCARAVWIDKGVMLHCGNAKAACDKYLQAFYEHQDERGTTTKLQSTVRQKKEILRKDPRVAMLSQTNLRNDIKLREFNPEAESFGTGAANVVGVEFCDEHDQPLSWIVGGEPVAIAIRAQVHVEKYTPILGFYIKDKLGQILFGDNTYLSYMDQPLVLSNTQCVEAIFSFDMPILPKGDYSICVAIAEGSSESHVPAHWINDALIFKSEASSLTQGLVGIPMHEIKMQAVEVQI